MTAEFKDHFSERAAGYASFRPHYPPELAAWLASIAPARSLAWDAACGSGQLSTLLANHFEQVVATDASAAQIAQALPRANVEYRVEPAEKASLGDRTVDLIAVAQAVHWLSLPEFYTEVRRVARPGAVIALVAYAMTLVDPAVNPIIEEFYSGDLDGWWPPERSHIESEYRLLDFPFEPISSPPFEMRVSWSVDEILGYIRTWSAVRAMEAAHGTETTDRFAEKLRRTWGPGKRVVSWPFVARVGKVS